MTVEELEALFEKHNDNGDEFLKWERVKDRCSECPDIHAFLLLDKLCPRTDGHRDMIQGASHDEIYLRPDPEELAAVVTEEQVIELVRCGVRLDENGLCMFV